MPVSQSLVPVDSTRAISTSFAYDPALEWERQPEPPNRLFEALRRARLTLLGGLACGAVAGLLLAYLTPPTYRAEGQIEFEQASPAAAKSHFGDAEVQFIRSHSLAQKVAESERLGSNKRFAIALGVGRLGSAASNSELIDRVRSRVGVQLSGDSRVATISFDSGDPLVSAAIANSYLNNFIESSIERQYDTTAELRRALDEQLATTRARLDSSEKALIDYTRGAGLIDSSAGTSSVSGETSPHSLSSDNLAQINQAYTQARADRIAAEQRWQQAQRTALMSLPEVINDPTIQQLQQKSAEAQADYQEQRQHRLDTNPFVVAAAAQIDEINRQIQSLATSIRDSIQNRYQVARRQEADLARNVGQLENQTLADQGKGAKYNVLKRNADSNRQLYEALLQRSNSLTTSSAVIPENFSIIDRAARPATPVSPKPLLWSAIGAAIAFLLAAGFALISGLRDNRVHSPEVVDSDLHLRVLGVLPRVSNPAEALSDPASPLVEAHYSLRTSLELVSPPTASLSILFTSSTQGEGKSTAAYGVARDFACSGMRTLLIDGDMRKPSVDRFVHIDSPLGLSTVLAELCVPEAATLQTDIPHLSVMLAGPMPPSPAGLLSDTRFGALLKHFSQRFEVIVIDAPPVYGLADSPRMAASADYTVLVVESDRARLPEVRGALRRLVEAGASVAGAVLTKFDLTKSRSNLYVYSYAGQEQRPRLKVA